MPDTTTEIATTGLAVLTGGGLFAWAGRAFWRAIMSDRRDGKTQAEADAWRAELRAQAEETDRKYRAALEELAAAKSENGGLIAERNNLASRIAVMPPDHLVRELAQLTGAMTALAGAMGRLETQVDRTDARLVDIASRLGETAASSTAMHDTIARDAAQVLSDLSGAKTWGQQTAREIFTDLKRLGDRMSALETALAGRPCALTKPKE